jgi:putative spermidine/putrescine transport system ATP-binding protein
MRALDDLSLDVAPGSFQALLGPSGSGNTSVLMSVAGFLEVDEGRILVNEQDISRLPPEKRNFGMVFQGYALFPHLSVLDNVGFSLRARGVPRGERRRRAGQAIEMVRLSGLENRLPRQLSGGQQQRVALARAIAFQPDLLLLDEPLSALDRQLRGELQVELRDLQRRTGLTCLYVTHDQDEALSMADAIAVLANGRILQSGPPGELYERPASKFVASFLGKSNFIEMSVAGRDKDYLVCQRGNLTIFHRGETKAVRGDTVLLALRPEKLRVALSDDGERDLNTITVKVLDMSYLGNAVEIIVEADVLGRLIVRAPPPDAAHAKVGNEIRLAWLPDATAEIRPDDASRHLA